MSDTPLGTERLKPARGVGEEIVADILPGYGPALVYLHGMSSTREGTKSNSLLALARSRGQAYARFDFRGHGESSGHVNTTTVSNLIEDTAAVLTRVGRSTLIGSSLGGLAAAWTAARHPEAVAAVVLLSPALGFLPRMAEHTEEFELHRRDKTPITLQGGVLADARQYDEAELPRLLDVPVLLIHGSEDLTVPWREGARFCDQIRHTNKELWVIEGGSHSLTEDVGEVWDRVEAFVDAQALRP